MKTLIVDDHPLFRAGLAALLEAEAGAVVLEASDVVMGLGLVGANPDLDAVLLDLALPAGGGMGAIPRFCAASPTTPVIVLSASEDPGDVRSALEAGALGYIPKSASAPSLLAALRFVTDGNVYVPPSAVRAPSRAGRAVPLTARQIEVLRILARGWSNKEVARALGVSDKTVKAHLAAIFQLLGVTSRTEAAAVARELGLI
jgi:DNA-binding NarL/FixJ family response regulator